MSDKLIFKIAEDVNEIKIVQARQEINLQEHMKRSDLLEKRTDKLFEELEPVRKHVYYVNGAFKLVAVISLLVGIAVGIIEVVKFFSH